jgi:hypothetical protein
MFEDEDRPRQRPSAKYESGICQARKQACNLCLALLRNDDQKVVGELPPDCRRELSDLLRCCAKPVQASHERSKSEPAVSLLRDG